MWTAPRSSTLGADRGEEAWLAEEALSEAYGEGTASWLSPGIETIGDLQCQVLSWSGDWSWAISLLQLGVRGLPCYAFGEAARRSLMVVAGALPQLVIRPVGLVLVPGAMTFSHVGKIADLERLVCLFAEGEAGSARGMVSFPRKWRRAGLKRISEAFGCNLGVRDKGTRVHLGKLSHAAIGGLTNGAFALTWWGFDAAARYRVDLGRVPCAVRDPVVFLEPLAKLTVWRRLDAVERATVNGVTESWVRLGGMGPDAGRRCAFGILAPAC